MCENIFNKIKEIFGKNKEEVLEKKLEKITNKSDKNTNMYTFGSDILIKSPKKKLLYI